MAQTLLQNSGQGVAGVLQLDTYVQSIRPTRACNTEQGDPDLNAQQKHTSKVLKISTNFVKAGLVTYLWGMDLGCKGVSAIQGHSPLY